MRVLDHQFPPNFDEIAAVLPEARNSRTIFCYGDTIYNPGGGYIPPSLHAHEAVHSERQGTTDAEIREWWRKYLTDKQFCLAEELLAHRAEYAAFCAEKKDRNTRYQLLVLLAKRLSGPLYGKLIGYDAAKKAIANEPPRVAACPKCHRWFETVEARNEHKEEHRFLAMSEADQERVIALQIEEAREHR